VEEAKAGIDKLLERMKDLLQAGPYDSWKVDKEILMNDIREFAKMTFAKESTDHAHIMHVFNPRSSYIYGTEWSNWVQTYGERMETALSVVRHRLEEGQTKLLQVAPGQHLIEPGTPHTAYVLLRDIVGSASRFVFLVDPYVDRSLFSLLSNVHAGVEIRILTRQQSTPPDFVAEASKFAQQMRAKVECRAGLSDFHDRFLVVDDKVFFSGASFKDLGKKGSVVAELQDIRLQTRAELENRWNVANRLE
jgi:hypothetical protein